MITVHGKRVAESLAAVLDIAGRERWSHLHFYTVLHFQAAVQILALANRPLCSRLLYNSGLVLPGDLDVVRIFVTAQNVDRMAQSQT